MIKEARFLQEKPIKRAEEKYFISIEIKYSLFKVRVNFWLSFIVFIKLFLYHQDNQCVAKNITDDTENIFFGMVSTPPNGINMKPANNFLHFNNGYPHVKLDQTTWRGIPVNHFQSCQDWPELNATYTIDYYFKGSLIFFLIIKGVV